MTTSKFSFGAGGYVFTLLYTPRGVSGLAWRTGRAAAPAPAPAFVRDAARKVREYFEHGSEIHGVRLDLSALGTFQRRACTALRRIPRGKVVSYGRLAVMAGRPGAARAAGAAMARNPLPIILPCHRVVASDGSLRGFSGRGGLQTKARLLSGEGVRWERDGIVSSACMRV